MNFLSRPARLWQKSTSQVRSVCFVQDVMFRSIENTTYKQIFNHPFNQSLMKGTLDEEIFNAFIKQDLLYLGELSTYLKILSDRAPHEEFSSSLLNISANVGEFVKERKASLSLLQLDHTHMNEACERYTNFLHHNARESSFALGVTSSLACYTIYANLGRDLTKHSIPGNRFLSWIETYTSNEFLNDVNSMIAIAHKHSQTLAPHEREAMLAHYHQACNHELAFYSEVLK
jgi:thiaminase